VHRRAGLLRAAIASAGNDHRLGANEAPPAIISVFLGEQLTRILDAIERGEMVGTGAVERIHLGLEQMPEVARDYTDRNRTSPFAFTGNKFEFRAVSSAASISPPIAALNAAVGEALGELEAALRQKSGGGTPSPEAVLDVIRQAVTESKAIRFEGNNYAAEWVEEARRRGLPNLRSTPEALAEMGKAEAVEFLARTRVFSPPETEARYHVRLERYVKDVDIEVEALRAVVSGHVLPAAYRQLALLTQAGSSKAAQEARQRVEAAVEALNQRLSDLNGITERTSAESSLPRHAEMMAAEAVPAMASVREVCDRIEEMVADEFWTLPKYSEMLFIV
jgi:glutamine synthetase